MSMYLVVLVVVLLLDGEDYLVHEEAVFVSILGMPLEKTLLSVRSPSKQE
jgi:hypothetical protein